MDKNSKDLLLSFCFRDESVHSLSPPQFILGGLILDDALIPRRPAGLRPGQSRQSPARRDERPFLVLNRLLIQLCTTYTALEITCDLSDKSLAQ